LKLGVPSGACPGRGPVPQPPTPFFHAESGGCGRALFRIGVLQGPCQLGWRRPWPPGASSLQGIAGSLLANGSPGDLGCDTGVWGVWVGGHDWRTHCKTPKSPGEGVWAFVFSPPPLLCWWFVHQCHGTPPLPPPPLLPTHPFFFVFLSSRCFLFVLFFQIKAPTKREKRADSHAHTSKGLVWVFVGGGVPRRREPVSQGRMPFPT